MCSLPLRVSPSNHWAWFAIAELPLPQEAAAMTRSQAHAMDFLHISSQGLSIPEIAHQVHIARFASEDLLHIGQLLCIQFGRAAAAIALLKSGQAVCFITLNPISDSPGRIT